MEQYLYRILFFSSGLILAAAAGIIRYRYAGRRYQPFIIYLCAGVLSEVVSFFSAWILRTNAVSNNFFMLAEVLLLNWQFKRWNSYGTGLKWYNRAAVFFCSLFLIQAAWKGIDQELFYFNVLYCCYLVTCGLERMSQSVVFSHSAWYKNSDVIICCGMVIYFSCRVIIETFWLYGLFKSPLFRNEVHGLMVWIDLFVNFMYVYAILWIQKKPGYITFYGQRWF